MAPDPESVKRLQDQTVSAFRKLRGLDASKENDFEIVSNESMRAMFDNLATGVTNASAFMCFLSLIVGGIGRDEHHAGAVTERTREIGLRKALGARRMRILMQFVIEAVLLAAFGAPSGSRWVTAPPPSALPDLPGGGAALGGGAGDSGSRAASD